MNPKILWTLQAISILFEDQSHYGNLAASHSISIWSNDNYWVIGTWHQDYMFTPFSQGQFSFSGQMEIHFLKRNPKPSFCLFPGSTCSIWPFWNPLALASMKMKMLQAGSQIATSWSVRLQIECWQPEFWG